MVCRLFVFCLIPVASRIAPRISARITPRITPRLGLIIPLWRGLCPFTSMLTRAFIGTGCGFLIGFRHSHNLFFLNRHIVNPFDSLAQILQQRVPIANHRCLCQSNQNIIPARPPTFGQYATRRLSQTAFCPITHNRITHLTRACQPKVNPCIIIAAWLCLQVKPLRAHAIRLSTGKEIITFLKRC